MKPVTIMVSVYPAGRRLETPLVGQLVQIEMAHQEMLENIWFNSYWTGSITDSRQQSEGRA